MLLDIGRLANGDHHEVVTCWIVSSQRPHGAKKLRGSTNVWRVRVGDWRILYEIDDANLIVDIAAIRHRRKAYE